MHDFRDGKRYTVVLFAIVHISTTVVGGRERGGGGTLVAIRIQSSTAQGRWRKQRLEKRRFVLAFSSACPSRVRQRSMSKRCVVDWRPEYDLSVTTANTHSQGT